MTSWVRPATASRRSRWPSSSNRTWSSWTSRCPVMDGAVGRGRDRQAAPLPVIMLTAFSQTELVERAGRRVMAYIVKPFTAADLAPAITSRSRWA